MAVKDDMPTDVRQRANVDNPDWYAGRPASARSGIRGNTFDSRAQQALSVRRKARAAARRQTVTKLLVAAPLRLLRIRPRRWPL
jgi:hypothetical protein